MKRLFHLKLEHQKNRCCYKKIIDSAKAEFLQRGFENLCGLFEPIFHTMKQDDAIIYARQDKYFFDVGWTDILKLKK